MSQCQSDFGLVRKPLTRDKYDVSRSSRKFIHNQTTKATDRTAHPVDKLSMSIHVIVSSKQTLTLAHPKQIKRPSINREDITLNSPKEHIIVLMNVCVSIDVTTTNKWLE